MIIDQFKIKLLSMLCLQAVVLLLKKHEYYNFYFYIIMYI